MPIGTLVLPDPSDVRLGVQYGAGGIEYTGTLFVPIATDDPQDFHSPAQIVRQLLIDINLCSDQDGTGSPMGPWPVYDNNEPTQPDNEVTVYDYDGPDQGRTNPDGEMQGPHGIQFRVRGKTKLVGYSKASRISEDIEKSPLAGGICYNRSVKVEETWYIVHAFSSISDVIPLGKESPTSTRRLFVINCVVTITKCP